MKISNTNTLLPYPKCKGKLSSLTFPTYVQTKHDGISCIYTQGKLIDKGGNVRTDCPITDYLSSHFDNDTILYGELIYGEGKANDLYNLLKHYKDDTLRYVIFDVHTPEIGGLSLLERRIWLISRLPIPLPPSCPVMLVEALYCPSRKALNAIVKQNYEHGYEGVVCKPPHSILYAGNRLIENQNWVKIKHKYTEDVKITHIDDTQERMEVDFKGKTVGVKLADCYRSLVKVGDMIELQYFGKINNNLRNPIFLGKVLT